MGAIAWLAGVIGLAGLISTVVYYVRRALDNSVSLAERDAALQVDDQRLAAEQAAADSERAKRAKEFDAKVAAVHTVDDAVAVLRGELSRASGTQADQPVSGAKDAASTPASLRP